MSLAHHLLVPHNGHVVPLFRIETYLLAGTAGSLENVPRVLCWASIGTLLSAMAIAGHLVAWETSNAALGLAAMAAVGFSTVLGPAILWYAAGQALATGIVILIMLAAIQGFRARGSAWLLAVGILAAAMAPLVWSAGYTAGLAGFAYLWSDGRRACRLASPLPLAGSAITGLLVWPLASPELAATGGLSQRSTEVFANLPSIAGRIAQATCEALVINNLGLDAATSASQAVVLLGIVVGIWLWSRRLKRGPSHQPQWRLNPLEAAGGTLIFTNFGLIFAARGLQMTYDNLRALGWYHAIAELGAVLFAAGWWSGQIDSPPPRSIEAPSYAKLGGAALFAAILFMMQAPRAQRVIFQYDGAASEVVAGSSVAGPRTSAELADRARLQRAALAKLDQAERLARESRMSRGELLRSLNLIDIPGIPLRATDFDLADLLGLNEAESGAASERKPRIAPVGSDHE